ncbi:hypothetical protein YPPY66_3790, partial [Yersinia pestis PY-66]
MIRFITVNVLN